MDNHEAQVELPEILLVLQIAIYRYKDVKLFLGQHQQSAVLHACPTYLSDSSYGVAGKSSAHSGVDALV